MESVLDQTYQDFEIIVVDDGSMDRTETTVRDFKNERIRYLRLAENRGPSAAKNAGINASSGRYIALLDRADSET